MPSFSPISVSQSITSNIKDTGAALKAAADKASTISEPELTAAPINQTTWSERFAQQNDTTQNLLSTPSTFDSLQSNRAQVPINYLYGSGGHLLSVPRPAAIEATAQSDDAFMDDAGEQAPEQSPEQRAEALREQGYTDATVEQILADINILKQGNQVDQVQAVFSLAENLQPDNIGKLAEELGIDDQAIVKLLTDSKAIGAVSTLVSEDASTLDKLSAAITLAESTGGLASGNLEQALKKPLAAISSGQQLITLIETFRNPDATALEKTEAVLAFVVAAKSSLGGLLSQLGHELRRLETLGNSVSAALTILDPNATFQERLSAVADLFVNVPDVKDDPGRLKVVHVTPIYRLIFNGFA